MIVRIIITACVWFVVSPFAVVIAQSPIITLRLAKDQIATVKTAPGITTRIVFMEQVSEIICGDLYDSATGRGSFVVQRGGKDVFLKPVATKGLSNMFVKTGENGENVYSFDLSIVAADQAFRIVNVLDAQGTSVAALRTNGTATRIAPPDVAGLGSIDWKVLSPLNGFAPASYIVPTSIDLPPPPEAGPDLESPLPGARVPVLGVPTKRVEARYPEFARASRVTGDVVIEITVSKEGKVISARPVSGPALLRQAALRAALGWIFTPTTIDGEPTQSVGTITFKFRTPVDGRAGRPQR